MTASVGIRTAASSSAPADAVCGLTRLRPDVVVPQLFCRPGLPLPELFRTAIRETIGR
ncbi:MAG TPA: hypothetical protein VH089_21585 [Streptosporangiaceae bacterium]|nr:hypothetical protein [Streptosporangiaceae bacterium]